MMFRYVMRRGLFEAAEQLEHGLVLFWISGFAGTGEPYSRLTSIRFDKVRVGAEHPFSIAR